MLQRGVNTTQVISKAGSHVCVMARYTNLHSRFYFCTYSIKKVILRNIGNQTAPHKSSARIDTLELGMHIRPQNAGLSCVGIHRG